MTPRQIKLRLERFPFVVSVSAALSDWRARQWLRRHPERSFADYYVAVNEARIRAGRPHPTLGRAGYLSTDRRAVTWSGSTFRERGRAQWLVYRDHGLTPSMRTLDYGCGSLRLGQHAIGFLDADRYCGVDPSPHFIEDGLSLLDPIMVAEKRPWLGDLSDETIAKVRKWQPQFIFSHAVLQHVPPDELEIYFYRLGSMMLSDSKAVIMFPCATREKRIKAMSWAYPQAKLEELAKRTIPDVVVHFSALPKGNEAMSGGGRRLMTIRRHHAER